MAEKTYPHTLHLSAELNNELQRIANSKGFDGVGGVLIQGLKWEVLVDRLLANDGALYIEDAQGNRREIDLTSR